VCVPGGYFEDVSYGQCSTCDTACLTCDGNGTSLDPGGCVSCSAFTLQRVTRRHQRADTSNASSSECVTSCPTGTYAGTPSLACMTCDPECGSSGCFGPGPSACGAPSRALNAADCAHVIRGRTCVASCNSTSEFLQSATNPVCLACHAECDGGCDGADASQCVSCRSARYGRTCVSECPVGAVVVDPVQRVCVDCHSECYRNNTMGAPPTCNGTSSSSCAACAHFVRRGACVPGCNAATGIAPDTTLTRPLAPNETRSTHALTFFTDLATSARIYSRCRHCLKAGRPSGATTRFAHLRCLKT
jgi:hypothetical protein